MKLRVALGFGAMALLGCLTVAVITMGGSNRLHADSSVELLNENNQVVATLDVSGDDVTLSCNDGLTLAPGDSGKICNNTTGNKTVRICPTGGGCCCVDVGTLGPGQKMKITNNSGSSSSATVTLV